MNDDSIFDQNLENYKLNSGSISDKELTSTTSSTILSDLAIGGMTLASNPYNTAATTVDYSTTLSYSTYTGDEVISELIVEKFDKYGFKLSTQQKDENPEDLIKGGTILGFNNFKTTTTWFTRDILRNKIIELEANDDMYFEPFKVIISAGISFGRNDQLIVVKNFPAIYMDEEEREKILKIIGKAIEEIEETIDSELIKLPYNPDNNIDCYKTNWGYSNYYDTMTITTDTTNLKANATSN